ncbi:MAG: hypothetical protein ACI9J5_003241 [Paraglaciecola sp.]
MLPIRKHFLQLLYYFFAIFFMASHAHAWKMEAGKLVLSATSSLTQLQSHSFTQTYDTPPIVIALPTTTGSNASALRISNVTVSGFRLSPVEPFSEDGPHAAMTVSYIAIEAGTHAFPNGEVIEAGTLTTDESQYNGNPSADKGWGTLNYSQNFSSPVVFAAIQTINNETGGIPRLPSHPWLTAAINNITNTQADIALERSEVYDSIAGSNYKFDALNSSESVGYVVMDSGVMGNFRARGNLLIDFESIYSTGSIVGWSDGCDSVNFSGSYSATPIAIATKSTHNEVDGGWLRECSTNTSRVQLTIDEDTSQDGERNHISEDTSILLFSQTFVYDSNAATSLDISDSLMLETNIVSLNPSSFTTINFDQVYEYPPAVFLLEDDENPEPSSIRIKNVTEQGFDVIPVEPDSSVSDAVDQNTLMHYLAISKGEHAFPDGKKIEIGPTVPPNAILNFQANRLSGDSWFSFNFATTFGSTPALLSQIQSMNNEASHTPGAPSRPWMMTAVRNATATGGEIALDRSETNTGALSTAEEIAFLATESGIITDFKGVSGNTISAEAQATPDSIAGTLTCYTYNFLQTYPSPPLVMGSKMTRDGGDGGWLRRCSANNSQVSLKIDEDWASDTDNTHTTERAGFLVFSEPFYADFSLVANYHLEDPNWNGTAGEVIDSSNTGAHGQRMGDATPRPAKVCNGASLDGTRDYIQIPDNSELDISDELTAMAWVNPASFPASDLMTIVSKDANFEFHLDPTGQVLWWWTNSSGTSRSFTSNATNVTLGNWHHVAITYSKSAGSQKIYIDGVETNSESYAGESLINNNLPLYIGTDDNYPSRDFDGSIDEVKIFKRALSIAAIQKYAAETRPCASCALDHFDITQPTYTLACPDTRAEITITAICTDGSVKDDYLGTVDLSGPSGSTFFDAAVAGSAITALSYGIADAGENTAYLYFNDEQNGVQVTANDTAASVSSTAATGTNFRAFGFNITSQPSPFVCASTTSMTMTAFGKVDSDPGGACEVLSGFTGAKTLDAWFGATLDDDLIADIVTSNLSVDGTAISAQTDAADNNLTLNFVNGSSSFDIGYPNSANILALNFRFDSAPYDGSEFSAMGVSTSAFVVRPDTFLLSAKSGVMDINGNSDSTTVTHKAGLAFDLSIIPMCSDGNIASDYQPNNSTSSVMTYLQRTGPLAGGSVDGTMQISASTTLTSDSNASITWESTALSASDFINGEYSYAGASYSEVGLTRLHIIDQDYFDEEVTPIAINIGRFTPDHFTVDVNSGSLSAFCSPAGAPDFSYIQQVINYATPPSLTIKARNTDDVITNNYTEGNYLKLVPVDVQRSFPIEDFSKMGVDGLNEVLLTSSALIPGAFTSVINGEINYSFLTTDSFTYPKNANSLVEPFNSDIRVAITDIVDSDTVGSNAEPYAVLPPAIEIRYGRWVMDNAYGPEVSDLPIPMRVEHWDGSAFVNNTSDDCTNYNASNLTDTEFLTGGSTTPNGSGTVSSGEAPLGSELFLLSPGANNVGTVNLEFQVDDWLQYDWDNNSATLNTNPTSTAIFGQYRGHDRVIYWREVLN